MPKKKTEEEFIEELSIKNPNAKLLGSYINARTKTEFLCLIHDEKWITVPDLVIRGHGCKKCHGERTRKARVWTQEQYIEELKKRNPMVELVGEYTDTTTKTKHHCLTHDVYWDVMPSSVLAGKGCKLCHGERISKTLTKTQEQYIEELSHKNPNVILIGEYINDRTGVLHRCLIHDYEWTISPNSVLAGHGCPLCRSKKISQKKNKGREQYEKELAKKNPTVILLGDYINIKTKTTHYCMVHKEEYETTPLTALKGCGCPKCHLERNWYARRKPHEQYEKEIHAISPHIEVIEMYINSTTPIEHYCTIHDIYWKTAPSSILAGCECPKCAKEKIRTKLVMSNDEYVYRLMEINPAIIPLESYTDSKTPIPHYHQECGHVTKMLPSSALGGAGCVLCKGVKIRNAFVKSQEDFEFELSLVNPNIKIISKYEKTIKKIDCLCMICGYEWSARASHLLEGHGCPKCKEPIGEKLIATYLDSKKICYKKQKTFKELLGVGGLYLSYDFYIPYCKTLIEFQGEQHERPIELFGGKKTFEIQKEHDRRKKEYAISHGYNFLEIFYKDIDKIGSILDEYFQTLKSETVTTTGIAQ